MSEAPSDGSLVVGETWSQTRILRQEDFDAFAKVSGDDNPIHVDPDFSARTRFGKTVSHGMLLYSVLWGMIKDRYPDARQISQELKFPAPTFTDEPVRFDVEIADLSADGQARLITRASTPSRGTIGLEGIAVFELKEA